MLTRIQSLYVVGLLLLATAMILVVYTHQRQQEFDAYHRALEDAVVQGAARALTLQVAERQRNVTLFAEEYGRTIGRLVQQPDDEATEEWLRHRLAQRFEDFLTFTVAGPRGEPLLANFDMRIGEVCRRDLGHFYSQLKAGSQRPGNRIFIHPQPGMYHYDVMAPLQIPGRGADIFFVSFRPDALARTLRQFQLPGHRLLLTRRSDDPLIEIAAEGARDRLRRDLRLTDAELNRVRAAANIAGTDWRLIDLPDPAVRAANRRHLLREAGTLFGLVLLAAALLLVLVWRWTRRCPD